MGRPDVGALSPQQFGAGAAPQPHAQPLSTVGTGGCGTGGCSPGCPRAARQRSGPRCHRLQHNLCPRSERGRGRWQLLGPTAGFWRQAPTPPHCCCRGTTGPYDRVPLRPGRPRRAVGPIPEQRSATGGSQPARPGHVTLPASRERLAPPLTQRESSRELAVSRVTELSRESRADGRRSGQDGGYNDHLSGERSGPGLGAAASPRVHWAALGTTEACWRCGGLRPAGFRGAWPGRLPRGRFRARRRPPVAFPAASARSRGLRVAGTAAFRPRRPALRAQLVQGPRAVLGRRPAGARPRRAGAEGPAAGPNERCGAPRGLPRHWGRASWCRRYLARVLCQLRRLGSSEGSRTLLSLGLFARFRNFLGEQGLAGCLGGL